LAPNSPSALIGYLYGITSERKLVEELRMHLGIALVRRSRSRSRDPGVFQSVVELLGLFASALALGCFGATKLTRAWEPTLLWNQFQ
jgi:hypothetical protein